MVSKRQILKAVWKRHGHIHDENYGYMYYLRWQFFYWIKTLICVLLNRRLYIQHHDEIGGCGYIVMPGNHERYELWYEVGVGRGVFRRWYYVVYDNAWR